MGHIEQGDAFTAALNAQQWDTVASYLTDDYIWTTATGSLDKQGFIALQKAWFAAAPDYRITWSNAREEGDMVRGTVVASGTQTQPLALPSLPPIPATGRPFSVTFETTVTWRGDQIAATTTGPATPDVFDQLGVPRPG
jgi:hypothetical protein